MSKSKGVDTGKGAEQAEESDDQGPKPTKPRTQARKTERITLDKTEYDSLIDKLTTLESELGQARKLLEAPAKTGWWRRIFRK